MIDAKRPPKRLGRRLWFKVMGGAAVGLGGLLLWQTSGYEVAPAIARRLVALSPKEFLIVSAAAERIVRSERPEDPGADEVEAAFFVDSFVARLDEAQRDDLIKLIHLLEHGLPLASKRWSRFTQLDGEGQDEVLRAMMTSDVPLLRGAFDSLKSLCVMAYYRDPRTWAAIGYDGPLVGR